MFFHVKLLASSARRPARTGSPDSVGYDLYAPEDGELDPLQRRVVKLGFAASFSRGWVAKIFDRSGLAAKHGITCPAAAIDPMTLSGVIDPDYRGEWGVILYNTSYARFEWKAGDRLAQVVFLPVGLPVVEIVDTLEDTVRGEGGYGSSGK